MTTAVHTFRAPSMPEALAQVRRVLGSDAVILETRQLSGPGRIGLTGPTIEIVAVSAEVAAPPLRSPVSTTFVNETLAGARVRQARPGRAAPSPQPTPDPWTELQHYLEAQELPADVVAACLASVREPSADARVPDAIAELVTSWVAACFTTAPPIEAGVPGAVALVGPTGVGKTTTLAKLATQLRLQTSWTVAMVSMDDYRIGAWHELAAYADILDVPHAVAPTADRLRDVLRSFRDADLVLIDTAGRTPLDSQAMARLADGLSRGIEIHLVMSATTRETSLRSIARRFAALRIDRVILTKLDELPVLGPLVGAAAAAPAPLSYLGKGQTVPDDLEAAEPYRLAGLALGYERLHGVVPPLAAGQGHPRASRMRAAG